ncbi:MAG TPA: alpha/beta fold hydrolase [Solirubrobacter sp.]|nr:alpha/beta fold hydrolase [Solirubrobacter sp.]
MTIHSETHGSGDPILLLHGGIGSGAMFASLTPALARTRQVTLVDLPGHGRSPDPGGPLDPIAFADAIAATIDGRTDVLGYSLGGMVALRLALQHPDKVRNLILVSVAASRAGNHPDVIAEMDAMTPDLADALKGSPLHTFYAEHAPDPGNWGTLIAKTSAAIKADYDWLAELPALEPRTLLVYADADSIRPDHIVATYAALGGGLRDARWDGSQAPVNRLAVLPGTSHYDIVDSPLLAPAIESFLP